VDLVLADVEHKTAGLLLTLRRSKTDQEGRGQVVGIAHGSHPSTDPIAALDTWLALRGHEPGPLFTRVYYSRIHEDPISGNTITRMLHTRAKAAGLPAERITAHALRAGHATAAAMAGVPLERIAAQTRHRDLSVLVERYIRPLEALAHTSTRDLGREVWRTDGTTAGTTRVTDLAVGVRGLRVCIGSLVFFGVDEAGAALWTSDGTPGTEQRVATLPSALGRAPESLNCLPGGIAFTADDRLHGREVWTLLQGSQKPIPIWGGSAARTIGVSRATLSPHLELTQ
jgi:ELWxxDGT repeat protein